MCVCVCVCKRRAGRGGGYLTPNHELGQNMTTFPNRVLH